MATLLLDPTSLRPSVLTPPPSKSDAERALVLGRIVGWREPAQTGATAPRDVRTLAAGLETLAGATPGSTPLVDCADGGAPFRFLLGQAAVTRGAFRLTGTPRLGARPHRPLIESLLATLGASGLSIREGSPWPVVVDGVGDASRATPLFQIDARESSQFVSSLLLTCARLAAREGRAWSVALSGPLSSAGYLELTLGWLRRAGFAVETAGPSITVRGGPAPATPPPIPGDWSSIGYLLAIAWRSGGAVTAVDPSSEHPDRAVLRLFQSVGLAVSPGAEGCRVSGTGMGGLAASAAECPDSIPTLAALACALPSPSRFENTGILRAKESDRLEGIRELVAAAGGRTSLDGDALIVEPPRAPASSLRLPSHGDHRMAMSAAVLACLLRVPLELEEPECVAKSFPRFWDELAGSGAVIRGAPASATP